MVINIMTRDIWRAQEPKLETPINWKATHVFWMNVKRHVCYTRIHCVEILKRTQHYNMTVQNQRDIRYNFMIGGDGNVYEGRGWGHTPLLPREFSRVNAESCVIGFMGLFNTAKELPADTFKLGQDLVAYGVANEYISKDFRFFDLLSTELQAIRVRSPRTRLQPGSGYYENTEGMYKENQPGSKYYENNEGRYNENQPRNGSYENNEGWYKESNNGTKASASKWYESLNV